jgi:DNA invertase Pin-like site-specific DNA recombinase
VTAREGDMRHTHKSTVLTHASRSTVLGHTRLSWGEQDSGSPERQASAIQGWAKREQFAQVEIFADVEGRHSGRRNEGRPEWARLLARLDNDPTVAVVVVESIDRIFRNLKLLQQFVDDCVARGVRFVSIAENFDFKPPSQADNPLEEAMRRLALQQFGALAEAWSNMTSAKMQMKVAAWRVQGKYWGVPPFGTIRDSEDKLAPDTRISYWWHPERGITTEVPSEEGWQPRTYHTALLWVYELYSHGREGWGGIAEQVMGEGFFYKDKWSKPRRFLPDDVRRCINLHLTYEGHLITERADTLKEATIVKANAWDPIVPLPLIQRALEVLQGRRRTGAYTGKKTTFALTPLLHCADCNQHLSGQTSRHGTKEYRHSQRCGVMTKQINAARVEQEVNQLITNILLPPTAWDEMEAILVQIIREETTNPDSVRLTSLKAQRDNLKKTFREQQQYGIEVMSWTELASHLKPLDEEIAAIESTVAAQAAPVRLRDMFQRLHNVATVIEKASVQTQRELYAGLFKQLDVSLPTGELVGWCPTPWVAAYIQTVLRCGQGRSKMRIEGLEPPRPKPLNPKSSASTNSAISASPSSIPLGQISIKKGKE